MIQASMAVWLGYQAVMLCFILKTFCKYYDKKYFTIVFLVKTW